MGQDMISIKGTKGGLLILVNPSYHFEDIKQELQEKLNTSNGFFVGAKFALHSPDEYSIEEQIQLTKICCDNGLVPHEGILADPLKAMDKSLSKGIEPEEINEKCLLLQKNIRSGQSIQFPGHVTILGNVHRGAEIIAEGNILVMGSLKGIAHAGASGNTKALIVAYSLQPTQLRIADCIGRSYDGFRKADNPEVAYTSNGQIIIDRYDATRAMQMIS